MRRRKPFAALLTLLGLALLGYGWWTWGAFRNYVASADYVPPSSPFHPEKVVVFNVMKTFYRDPQQAGNIVYGIIGAMLLLGVVLTLWGLYDLFLRER